MRNTRQRRAKRRPYVTIVATILSIYVISVLLWPIHAVQATPVTIKEHAATTPIIEWPPYGQSAIGTGDYGVLATHGEQTAVPMASITKIVTALVVLDKKPIAKDKTEGSSITFTANDAARYNQYLAQDGSVAPVTVGARVTQQQIMQGMLISSANNYADTLAIWAYGSIDNYLAAAKTYLAHHDLHHTTVADASGFSPESKSSTSDLVKIGSLALEQPILADIVSQKSTTIPNIGTLNSTNLLLGKNGVIGIKTGTTDEAGSCLLFASQQKVGSTTVTIIGATLGAPNHAILARDVSTLITSTASNFTDTSLTKTGQSFAQYNTPWGSASRAIATENISKPTWAGNTTSQTITTPKIQPGDSTTDAGMVTFKNGSREQAVKLKLETPLTNPSWLWRLSHPHRVISL